MNYHSWCQIECRHTEDQRLSFGAIAGGDAIVRVEGWLGKDIQIVAVEETNCETVLFEGFVRDLQLAYELCGSFTARLKGVTNSYKMDIAERHEYYIGKALTEIAQQLADRVELDAKVQCNHRRPLNYVQWGETDWVFLRRLADDHGCWLRPVADGIEICDCFQPGTRVQWRLDSTEQPLTSFSISGSVAPSAFSGAHYDPHQMKSSTFKEVSEEAEFFDCIRPLIDAVKKSSKENLSAGYLHQRNRVVALDEYEQLLRKESVRAIGSSISGLGETSNPELLPGNMLLIEGPLDAAGQYGVTRVTHRWDATGYSNQFTCTPWKNYTGARPPASKPWFGVVAARVVEHNDPKKMGRIKVQYFWQEEESAHWARMMTPHAGADRGFMFMPEKGDEVVVVFEDGDPERPLILGCVWNGVDQAPRQQFRGDEIESNDIKRIMTKSGNRLQMIDKKGQESIVLATPHSIRIAMLEGAPENNGRTTLFVYSSGDILFNAPNGRIHFRSKFFSREIGDNPELDAPPISGS